LITGGCGFIGGHLSRSLIKKGHKVIVVDNFLNGNVNNVRDLISKRAFKLITGDVRDQDLLEKISSGIDSIVHLAAQIHVDRSIVEPQLTWEINVLGTLNVLETARRHDVEVVVHASTSEVYGSAQYVPMDENHPLNAPHPYGASKIAADRMCFAYSKTYGMDIRIVRLFNVFGPAQKETGYGGAISLFVRRALNGLPPIIYGSGHQTLGFQPRYSLENGLQDFIAWYKNYRFMEWEKPG
jgi:UDP-glucose 4-epimerase